MPRSDDHRGTVALLVTLALVTSGVAALPGHVAGVESPTAGAQDAPVTVAVDCGNETVTVAAPDDRRYVVRVAVVSVTPNESGARSRTTGPFAGNATVGFDGNGTGESADNATTDGTVHAFVLDESTRAVLARTTTRCPVGGGAAAGDANVTPNATAGNRPAVAIDCDDGSIRVVAPPDLEYDLAASFVIVTATETTTASATSGPNVGNTTVRFAVHGTITAFVLDSSTGEVLATAVEDCPRPTATAADTG